MNSRHLNLRFTYNHPSCLMTCDDIIELFTVTTKPSYYAYVKEKVLTNQAHLHLYVITEMKDATYRHHLRQTGKGNQVFKCTEMKKDIDPYAMEFLAYMQKEGELVSNMPLDWLEKSKNHMLQIKSDLKIKQIDKKDKSVFSELLSLTSSCSSYEQIYKICYNFYVSRKKSFSMNQLDNSVISIYCILNPSAINQFSESNFTRFENLYHKDPKSMFRFLTPEEELQFEEEKKKKNKLSYL